LTHRRAEEGGTENLRNVLSRPSHAAAYDGLDLVKYGNFYKNTASPRR
jgi:hypothetical protein